MLNAGITYVHVRSLEDVLHLGQVAIGCCFDQLLIDVTRLLGLKQLLQQLRQTLYTQMEKKKTFQVHPLDPRSEECVWCARVVSVRACPLINGLEADREKI